MSRWIVMAETEINDPTDPDLLSVMDEVARFASRDDANALAISLSRKRENVLATVADANRVSTITDEPYTLVALYVNGRRG